MVRLIMGAKGSGKTKHLIEMINNAAKDEPATWFALRLTAL